MAIVLPQIKSVYEYAVHELHRGDEDAFTHALHAVVDLTFEDKACKGSMAGVSLKTVKAGYKSPNIEEFKKNGDTVRGYLQQAYTAYHAGSRALPYDMYKMFVGACHTWGKLLTLVDHANDMQNWALETQEEHSSGGRVRHAGGGGDLEQHARMPAMAEMRALLGRLEALQ